MNFYEIANYIDYALKDSNPSSEKIMSTIDKLHAPGIESYFFDQVTGLAWFIPLKERGYFSASHNPQPQEGREKGFYTIPSWPALSYLEKISKACAKSENRHYAEEVMQIIRDVTRPKDAERADNFRTWWYFTKIMSNLLTEVITVEDINLVSDWLDSRLGTTLVDAELGRSLLPKLLQSPLEDDWKKATKLVEIVTRIRWVERKYGEVVKSEPNTAIDAYSLRDLFEKNGVLLGEKCGNEVVVILKKRLEEVFKPEKDDLYSSIWRPAIETHAADDVGNILISAFRDVLLAYAKVKNEEAKKVVRILFGESLFIIWRIALYVVSELYHIYGELFWEIIRPELFDMIHIEHELSELLKRNFRHFSPAQQDQIIDLVDALTRDWGEENQKPLFDAKLRLDWLTAIQGQGSKRADDLYQKYLKIAQPSEQLEFVSNLEVGYWKETSLYSSTELLNMSVPEIVHSLNTFKESGRWREPTEEGLANVLKGAVKQEPEKFQDGLSWFQTTKPIYQNAILRVFEELWKNKKPIDWGKVLEFCLSIVESETFWQQSDELQKQGARATRSWVTTAMSDLIKAGVQSDEWAFEETHLPTAERVILRILEKEPSRAEGRDGDALTEAMNTPKGRCLEALINFSLRPRLADKQKNDHSDFWAHIQPAFDRELDLCENDNLEFSALAGMYLPNLYDLSKDWVTANIDRIFSVDYPENWRCAMEGYSHTVPYKEIHRLLREHGHLKRGLETDFKNPNVRKKLIQHISVAYLWGLESLSGEQSLFAKILREWHQDDITEIIFFFWRNRESVKREESVSTLILDFWKWCYERIREHEEENAEILSNLNRLAAFLTEISDEQKSWLMPSAPYVDDRYHDLYFLEYLNPLTDNNPEAVADVYIEMLTRTVPTIMHENIRSIVEKLYKAGLREKANYIANAYACKGYPDLLRALYEQYNTNL
ncbi:hypothetical protein HYR99_25320 [Candidatus Poribacteria bacterium]|nr:hypothetical protein [Candidatus Poribacteria bacterium]